MWRFLLLFCVSFRYIWDSVLRHACHTNEEICCLEYKDAAALSQCGTHILFGFPFVLCYRLPWLLEVRPQIKILLQLLYYLSNDLAKTNWDHILCKQILLPFIDEMAFWLLALALVAQCDVRHSKRTNGMRSKISTNSIHYSHLHASICCLLLLFRSSHYLPFERWEMVLFHQINSSMYFN